MKIDAEGEETNILRGGADFLAAESPLIQYEIKAATGHHLDLVQQFLERGYRSYRLVRGLDLLIPFDDSGRVDGYLLNLFCCKPDKAARLAAQGFLLEAKSDIRSTRELGSGDASSAAAADDRYGWQGALVKLPYGRLLSQSWTQYMTGGHGVEVAEPLFQYSLSRDTSLSPAERFAALETSYLQLKQLCETRPVHLRLASLARVALDYGAREVAVDALARLWEMILKQGQVSLVEPFLAPGARFDSVAPPNQQAVASWVVAATLEELERNQYVSSYYSGTSNLRRLETIRDLGFGSDEMQRRLALIKQRVDTQGDPARAGR